MPRLVSKAPNNNLYIGLFLIFAIAAVLVEYFGIINLIPNFGRDEGSTVKHINPFLRQNSSLSFMVEMVRRIGEPSIIEY